MESAACHLEKWEFMQVGSCRNNVMIMVQVPLRTNIAEKARLQLDTSVKEKVEP